MNRKKKTKKLTTKEYGQWLNQKWNIIQHGPLLWKKRVPEKDKSKFLNDLLLGFFVSSWRCL